MNRAYTTKSKNIYCGTSVVNSIGVQEPLYSSALWFEYWIYIADGYYNFAPYTVWTMSLSETEAEASTETLAMTYNKNSFEEGILL